METKGLLTMSPQYPLRATFVSPWGGGGEGSCILLLVCVCMCVCGTPGECCVHTCEVLGPTCSRMSPDASVLLGDL